MTKKKNESGKLNPRLAWATIANLTMATYCPKRRISVRDKDMQRLIKSIEEFGVLKPICITKDGRIIDGHRRVAAMKQIGLEIIQAMVVSVISPDEIARLYAELNDTQEPLDKENS